MKHLLTTIIILIAVTCTVTGMAIAGTFPGAFGKEGITYGGVCQVPDVRAAEAGTSAVAAFQAVMAYYGIDRGEGKWQEILRAGNLTGPETMAAVARNCGLAADVQEGLGLADLDALVRNGIPVITPLRDGAYVVVIGTNTTHITLEDPAVLGRRPVLSRNTFEERWNTCAGIVIRKQART